MNSSLDKLCNYILGKDQSIKTKQYQFVHQQYELMNP